jgi:hypothetical protein
MSPRPTAIVVSLFIGACLALLAVFAVFAVLELDLVPRPSLRTDEGSDLERLDRRLSSIESRLEQLQAELQTTSSRIVGPESADRRPVESEQVPSVSSREIEELRAAIAALRNLPEAVPQAADDLRELARSPGDLSALFEAVRGREAEDFDYPEARRRLTEQHRLWTFRHLIERYGKPESVAGHNGDLFLEYTRPGSEVQFRFVVTGGYVVAADFDS